MNCEKENNLTLENLVTYYSNMIYFILYLKTFLGDFVTSRSAYKRLSFFQIKRFNGIEKT